MSSKGEKGMMDVLKKGKKGKRGRPGVAERRIEGVAEDAAAIVSLESGQQTPEITRIIP